MEKRDSSTYSCCEIADHVLPLKPSSVRAEGLFVDNSAQVPLLVKTCFFLQNLKT